MTTWEDASTHDDIVHHHERQAVVPVSFQFFSHKLGRLFLPYMLIAVFVSSFFLPPRWNVLVPAAQVAFYAVAVVDKWIPPSPVKKVSSLARTFVVLVWAALCATSIIFRPSESFWKTAR